MRGGVKGRLELFRKFIRFGVGMLPLHILMKRYKQALQDGLRQGLVTVFGNQGKAAGIKF